MKIAILNNWFLKEDHITKLKGLGEVTVYNETASEDQAIERLANTDIVIADGYLTPLNGKVLSSAQSLKLLVVGHTGYDIVDIDAATNGNIQVANVPDFATDAVAEHVIALMFSVIRHIPMADRIMREKPYQIDPADQTEQRFKGFNVKGKTLGVLGLGNIGTRVAELGIGLGMNIIAHDKNAKEINGVLMVPLEELLKLSDVISINLSLEKETENIISKETLKLIKPTCIIINTARGKHVDTEALYEALKNKTVTGAGLDIVDGIDKNHPLLSLDNVVITPHIAFFTQEAENNLGDIVVRNVEAFIAKNPINIVN